MNEPNETEAAAETPPSRTGRFDHAKFRASVLPITVEESRAIMAELVAREPKRDGFVSEEAEIFDSLTGKAAKLALIAEVTAMYSNPKDRAWALKQRWYETPSTPMGDCGHEGCGWRGPIDELSYLGPLGPGAIGPLCPDCGDTVEPDEGMEALHRRLGWVT